MYAHIRERERERIEVREILNASCVVGFWIRTRMREAGLQDCEKK